MFFVFIGCGTGYYSVYPDPTSCECEPCPIGTYNDQDDATLCSPCPNGLTTIQEGSDDSSLCITSENLNALCN